jgi:hypothetical protein
MWFTTFANGFPLDIVIAPKILLLCKNNYPGFLGNYSGFLISQGCFWLIGTKKKMTVKEFIALLHEYPEDAIVEFWADMSDSGGVDGTFTDIDNYGTSITINIS